MGDGKFIDLSEAEALAASMASLGISDVQVKKSQKERVFDATIELAKGLKRPVSGAEVSRYSGIAHRQVCDCLRLLHGAGRMFRFGPEMRPTYLPRVV